MMTLKEYIELIEYLNTKNLDIANISSDYNYENNMIWCIEITIYTGQYYECSKTHGLRGKETYSIAFTYNDCNLDNIKDTIDKLV